MLIVGREIPAGKDAMENEAEPHSRPRNILRWVLLVPVAAISVFLLLLGIVGTGLGSAVFMLPYLALLPAFLLNFRSPRASVIAMWALIVLQYVGMAAFNWPHINPVHLWSRGSILLLIAAILNHVAAIAPRFTGAFDPSRLGSRE